MLDIGLDGGHDRATASVVAKAGADQKRIFEVVPRGGIEPPTPAFSVQCSTN
jgi:hypothetical protein